MLMLTTMLLIGFAPVAWLFSQSTESVNWMGTLHIMFWFIAAFFGLRFLNTAFSHSQAKSSTGFTFWILKVREAVRNPYFLYPFMAYGTDWLAFGHFVIALAFVGPLRNPVRNRWLYQFGMISCALVIPYAMILGGARGIPIY